MMTVNPAFAHDLYHVALVCLGLLAGIVIGFLLARADGGADVERPTPLLDWSARRRAEADPLADVPAVPHVLAGDDRVACFQPPPFSAPARKGFRRLGEVPDPTLNRDQVSREERGAWSVPVNPWGEL